MVFKSAAGASSPIERRAFITAKFAISVPAIRISLEAHPDRDPRLRALRGIFSPECDESAIRYVQVPGTYASRRPELKRKRIRRRKIYFPSTIRHINMSLLNSNRCVYCLLLSADHSAVPGFPNIPSDSAPMPSRSFTIEAAKYLPFQRKY